MMISEEQLNNSVFLEEIEAKAKDIIGEDRFREAYDLGKALEQVIEKSVDFKDRNSELYNKYREIIIKLKWLGLPIMTEDMVVDYFKNNFTKIFDIPEFTYNDLWRKLSAVLLGMMVFKDRDKLKKRIIQVLMANRERITGSKIMVNKEVVKPTVANWMQDYNSTLGTGKVNKLERTQYLTSGENVKKLDGKEKARIKLLFDLYEKLKLSSLTLEGLEEDIPVDEEGMVGIIKGGVFEPFKEPSGPGVTSTPEARARIEMDKLKANLERYSLGSLERKAIEEEIAKLRMKNEE